MKCVLCEVRTEVNLDECHQRVNVEENECHVRSSLRTGNYVDQKKVK
jgi:hypothetical protein